MVPVSKSSLKRVPEGAGGVVTVIAELSWDRFPAPSLACTVYRYDVDAATGPSWNAVVATWPILTPPRSTS